MRCVLKWKIPQDFDLLYRQRLRPVAVRKAMRLSLTTLLVGDATWYGFIYWHQFTPRAITNLAGHAFIWLTAVYWWVIPLRYYFPMPGYQMSGFGISRGSRETQTWKRFARIHVEEDEQPVA